MSPRQIADDPGRQMRKPWLGPENLRWPMDWPLEQWALAFVSTVVSALLFIFVLPSGLLVGLVTYRVARTVSVRNNPDAPQGQFRLFIGIVVASCLIISADPMTWIRPLWFPFALLAAPLVGRYMVKHHGRFVNWNRPIMYWIRLPFQVARGPRPVKEAVLDPSPLMLGMRLETADHHTDLEPAVKPDQVITPPKPKRHDPEYRLVPLKPAPRHKFVERTETGVRVGGTEYRVEGTY